MHCSAPRRAFAPLQGPSQGRVGSRAASCSFRWKLGLSASWFPPGGCGRMERLAEPDGSGNLVPVYCSAGQHWRRRIRSLQCLSLMICHARHRIEFSICLIIPFPRRLRGRYLLLSSTSLRPLPSFLLGLGYFLPVPLILLGCRYT